VFWTWQRAWKALTYGHGKALNTTCKNKLLKFYRLYLGKVRELKYYEYFCFLWGRLYTTICFFFPHFKASSIISCHSRILRLLHTLSFFQIHKSLTREKNCTMSAPSQPIGHKAKVLSQSKSLFQAALITTASYSVPFHLSHTPNTTCVAPL